MKVAPLRILPITSVVALVACGNASDTGFSQGGMGGMSTAGANNGGVSSAGTGGSMSPAGGAGGGAAGLAGAASQAGQAGSSAGSGSGGGSPSEGGQGGSMVGSAGSSRGPYDIAPESGALLGAYVDGGQLTAREKLLDRKLAIHHRFFAWSDDWINGELKQDLTDGRVPMQTWEPHTASLPDIAAGNYDEMVRARAQAAKAIGKPILLRFGHEMNGDWYTWGGPKNGNEAGPAKYIAAWRHLHDLFSAEGASNVLWVWCPNSDSVPNVEWNQASAYYPGDAYVDWVAVDGYNWGTAPSWGKWRTFKDILSPVYASYSAMGKPFMVAETGSTETGGDKGAWFSAVQADMKAFPAIKALVYFDTYDANLKLDFKIDSSPQALTAFTALGRDQYFNP